MIPRSATFPLTNINATAAHEYAEGEKHAVARSKTKSVNFVEEEKHILLRDEPDDIFTASQWGPLKIKTTPKRN